MHRQRHRHRWTVLVLAATLLGCSERTSDPIADLAVDRSLHVQDAPAPIRIVTDEHGFRHVYARGLAAALFGQGYVTAHDRFWQMDVFRRVATGRLAAYLGELALPIDVAMRMRFLTREGRLLEEALAEHLAATDPEAYALLEAYTAGVNAWLADLRAGRNGARLPAEYDFFLIKVDPEEIPEWTPADSLAIARLQAWSLSDTVDRELFLDAALQELGEETWRDLYRFAPPSPALTLPPTTTPLAPAGAARPTFPGIAPAQPDLRAVHMLLATYDRIAAWLPWGHRRDPSFGSNNWIVGPRKSASGHAMLANDPHLALYNPPIWHVIHLDPTWNGGQGVPFQGVMFPGLPGVILGYNPYIAWGGTVVGYDVSDVYVEEVTTISGRTHVRFQGDWVPVLRKELRFAIKGGGERIVPVEIVPHHGPQLPDPDPDDDVTGLAAAGNMSWRWTGHELSNDIRFLYELNQARSVEDARAALERFSVGAQNWVVADIAGHILYFPYAWVPQRPAGAVPYLPLPGTGEAEWLAATDGTPLWVPAEKLPHALDPAEGFLATANNDIRGELQDNDPLNDGLYLYADRAVGFRQERILELLTATEKLTLEDMGRIQTDRSTKEAAYVLPHLFAAATEATLSPAANAALERLRAWETAVPGMPYAALAGIDPSERRDDIPPVEAALFEGAADAAVATSIFYAFMGRLIHNLWADEFAATEISYPTGSDATRALIHLLRDVGSVGASRRIWTAGPDGESRLWDDRTTPVTETRTEILVRSLEQAVADLTAVFGTPDQDRWLWGELHVLELQHFFGQAGFDDFSLGVEPPIPVDGARFTVWPAGFGLRAPIPLAGLVVRAGPSERFIVELDPAGPVAYNVIPGGESGDGTDERGDPDYDRIKPDQHYGDLLPKWLRGERVRYRFAPEEVAASAEEVWELR